MPDPLLTTVEQYRAALAAREAQAFGRLVDAYRRAYSRVATALDALLLQIGDNPPTRGQLVRMERYKSLVRQIADELQGFQSLTVNEVELAAELGVQLGVKDARNLLSVAVIGDGRIAAGFNALHAEAVKELLGFLSPEGKLYQRLRLIAPNTASLVSDAIVSGVTLGFNPRKTASIVRDAFGNGLTDALRQVRTVQLYSYREANRATYIANSDVVSGWIWHAEMGSRTCMSCVAQHGTIHPLSETLNDHWNGRCAMVPLVRGFEPVINEGDGRQWFEQQSEARQREMMGPGKYDAWKAGKFDFSQLTTQTDDRVYGTMRIEQTLQALVGA